MELDHAFIFTESPELAAVALQEFGLTEGPSNTHPGQGTACRRFFFQNAYLELVWVSDKAEIMQAVVAKTRLWERSQYKQNNISPFGICLKKNSKIDKADELFKNSWQYRPSYLPNGLFINIASNDTFYFEPMLFELAFLENLPREKSLKHQSSLTHKKGFREITRIIITVPAAIEELSTAMKKVIKHTAIELKQGNQYSLSLEFDQGIQKQSQSFEEIFPLVIRW